MRVVTGPSGVVALLRERCAENLERQLNLRLFGELRDALSGQQSAHQHRPAMRTVAVSVEDRRQREQHRTMLGQHDPLVAGALCDRSQERVTGPQRIFVEKRVVQRLMNPGVVTLTPDVTTFPIEKRHELDSRRVQERGVHVDLDEVLVAVLHELVGVDPVPPVRAEGHELRELAVQRARDPLHVGARGFLLERLEARQDDLVLDRVVDDAEHGKHRVERYHDLGGQLQADGIPTRIGPHRRS